MKQKDASTVKVKDMLRLSEIKDPEFKKLLENFAFNQVDFIQAEAYDEPWQEVTAARTRFRKSEDALVKHINQLTEKGK